MKSEQHSTSWPMQLAAGESSEYITLEASDGHMMLRVVDLGHSGSGRPQRPPKIKMQAESGEMVALKEFPNEQTIMDAENHVAGSATWRRKDNDLYLIRVSLDHPSNDWKIQIVNEDSDPHAFQVVGVGGTRIRSENGGPAFDVYCGFHGCACTRHNGFPNQACSSCGHSDEPW